VKRFYFAAKPFHMAVDVDMIAYPLHRPMTRSCQARGTELICLILSCLVAAVGGGTFWGM
jgi:hypothetical protein